MTRTSAPHSLKIPHAPNKGLHCPSAIPKMAAAILISLGLFACAEVPLSEGGSLRSYAALKPSDGVLTKTRLYVNKDAALAARSARILRSEISPLALQAGLTQNQLRLVSNAIDRAICLGLSRRFMIVDAAGPADLTVRTVITHIGKTDEAVAGLSAGLNIGGSVASITTGAPVPTVRIPIGMGGLSVEAQATGPRQEQVAAMIWARGADVLTTSPRAASEGDAHTLAREFGADFAKLLVTGTDPIGDQVPEMPTMQAISEYFGGRPKHAACEPFGRNPGLGDTMGAKVGLPPAWTDEGPQANADSPSNAR